MSSPSSGLLSLLSESHAATHGKKTALILGERQWTWEAFHDAVLRTVAALRAHGLKPGDRVAFLGYNSDEFVILLQACYRAGVVVAPLNWRMAPAEIAFLLQRSRASILVLDAEFLPVIGAIDPDILPGLILTVHTPAAGRRSFGDWIAAYPACPRDPVQDPDAIAVLLYTSGTSGFPKGALLSHGNIASGFEDGVQTGEKWGEWSFDDVTMVVAPIFHIGGTGSVTQGLIAGATIVMLPRPDITAMIESVARDAVTRLFAVPAMLNMILNDPAAEKADFSSIRCVCYGASPIPLDVLRRSMRKFPFADFVQLYGMTETAGVATWLGAADHDPEGNARMASCGKAYRGTEIVILGTDGARLPPGAIGEIAIRSSSVMHGYLDDPAATQAAIVDGFYRSGDAGFLDPDGYLYISDRVKDMIVSGGENIYPIEIERVLAEYPGVAECAVIGVPDDRWGEAVLAFIVAGGTEPDAEKLRAHLRARIGGFKIPKDFRFVKALPRNAAGKILKRELRAPFWKDQSRQVS